MEDKKESKVVITQGDQDELVKLLETFRKAIIGHEDRLQALEAAVVRFHKALTNQPPKMVIPKGR